MAATAAFCSEIADIRTRLSDVCFAPESRHQSEDIGFRKCGCRRSLFRENDSLFPIKNSLFQ
jgi:hypothetical protein